MTSATEAALNARQRLLCHRVGLSAPAEHVAAKDSGMRMRCHDCGDLHQDLWVKVDHEAYCRNCVGDVVEAWPERKGQAWPIRV